MSCFYKNVNETSVCIASIVETGGITFYDIQVTVKDVFWRVSRRYREFNELHEKLVCSEKIGKNLLPPKKVLGNKSPTFVEQRRTNLEKYLVDLLILLRMKMPRAFIEFLDFNKYDIVYLMNELAQYCYACGEVQIAESKEFTFTALELYAISERMQLPCPEFENVDQSWNFSHVLDFCSQLEILNITPTKCLELKEDYNDVDVPIGRSNIIPKSLMFHLNAFQALKKIKFYGISPESLKDAAFLKQQIVSINVHNTPMIRTNQIIMCDEVHRDSTISLSSSPHWSKLEELNIAGNLLIEIDQSMMLTEHLKILILDQNRITSIKNLNLLSELRSLSIAENIIENCSNLHAELGNLVSLNLSQNKLKSLEGLRKMYSLVSLDLSSNFIRDLEEIDFIASLPLLEKVRLAGNPISDSVDYRARVLARFDERAKEIILDDEKGTKSEMNTAQVLAALNKSKRSR